MKLTAASAIATVRLVRSTGCWRIFFLLFLISTSGQGTYSGGKGGGGEEKGGGLKVIAHSVGNTAAYVDCRCVHKVDQGSSRYGRGSCHEHKVYPDIESKRCKIAMPTIMAY